MIAEYGDKIRWSTVAANDDEKVVRNLLSSDVNLVGFSDSGSKVTLGVNEKRKVLIRETWDFRIQHFMC